MVERTSGEISALLLSSGTKDIALKQELLLTIPELLKKYSTSEEERNTLINALTFRAETENSPEVLSRTARTIGAVFRICFKEEQGQPPLALSIEAQKRLASALVSLSWRQIPEAYETAVSAAQTALDFYEKLDPQVQKILLESMSPKKLKRGNFESIVRQITDDTLRYSPLETTIEYNTDTKQVSAQVAIREKMGEPLAARYGQMFLSWIALRFPASQNIELVVTTETPEEYRARVKTEEFLDFYYKKELGTIS